MKSKAVWIVFVLVAGAVAICLGSQLASVARRDTERGGVVRTPSEAPNPSPRPGGQVREGTWSVGDEVKPGLYRTPGAIPGPVTLCYWHTEIDGEIKDQGVIDGEGEPGRVELKKGQLFKTNGCADWKPVKG